MESIGGWGGGSRPSTNLRVNEKSEENQEEA